MSLIILSLLALALVWRAARSAWHLWSLLPSSNADFGLADADIWGGP